MNIRRTEVHSTYTLIKLIVRRRRTARRYQPAELRGHGPPPRAAARVRGAAQSRSGRSRTGVSRGECSQCHGARVRCVAVQQDEGNNRHGQRPRARARALACGDVSVDRRTGSGRSSGDGASCPSGRKRCAPDAAAAVNPASAGRRSPPAAVLRAREPVDDEASRARLTTVCSNSRSSSAACAMECGVAAYAHAPAAAAPPAPGPAQSILSPTERSPAKSGLHVNFSDKGEVKERREKFLTAKYGSHQMALIRKRLAVEMWLYDELQKLYESNKESTSASASQEVEVDIDELLDMDSDELRRRHLTILLADAKKPQKDVHKFINELLEKAKTL